VRAVKAKTHLFGISFSIGEVGVLQNKVGASASGAPNKKPHPTSPRLRLMACKFAAQFLVLGAVAGNAPAPSEQGVQFTAPSRELHVANRDLGTVEHVYSNGDLKIPMDSGHEVRFNVSEHPHLDYGYAVTSHNSQGQTADRVLVHVDTEKSELLVNNRVRIRFARPRKRSAWVILLLPGSRIVSILAYRTPSRLVSNRDQRAELR